MQIRYPCSYINLHTTQLWFPRNQSEIYFLAAYYRGFGIHPIFSRGLGIHTNKLYFPCRTNRMLALNSKNLNFHFATQSGMIIEKKTLLSQPWIKNSLWFLGNTSYSKNPHDIFLYHGDFLFFLYLLACQYLYYKNFLINFYCSSMMTYVSPLSVLSCIFLISLYKSFNSRKSRYASPYSCSNGIVHITFP